MSIAVSSSMVAVMLKRIDGWVDGCEGVSWQT